MPLPALGIFNQGGMHAVEAMQVDPEMAESEANELSTLERNFVVENPTLDLESIATLHTGLMRIRRLMFIADHAPTLRIDALRLASTYVRKTLDIGTYQTVHQKLVEAIRSSSVLPDAVAGITNNIPSLDTNWIDQTTKHASTLLEKLDIDLKNYKNNSIKESIRRGFDDLGSHYLNMGDLNNALKYYSRARDYCTSPKHIVNMCLNVIKVCVYSNNWSHVLTYVNKAEATGDFNEKDRDSNTQVVLAKLRCVAGLANLSMGKYKIAAKSFLQVSVDHCDFPELLSASNVAIYGSLCALATFTRTELQNSVVTSSSFKMLLELEPTVREIVFAFSKSQYGKCLRMLQDARDNGLLDIYLSQHLDVLYSQIRSRALVQYFSPYKLADMHRMASAFNCTVNQLEDELMPLILDGQIQARIDSQNKILHAKDDDERRATFERTLQVGRDYLHRSKALILRNAVIQSNIQVKVPS